MRYVRSTRSEWQGEKVLPGTVAFSHGPLILQPGAGSCLLWLHPGGNCAAATVLGPHATLPEILVLLQQMRQRLALSGSGDQGLLLLGIGAPGFPKKLFLEELALWDVVYDVLPLSQSRAQRLVLMPQKEILVFCTGPQPAAPSLRQTPIQAGDGLDRFLEARPSLSTTATRFFRDAGIFQAIRELIIPCWRMEKRKQFHVWNPGCSVGAETYSMAMAIEETFTRLSLQTPHQTFGTDINPENIALARVGKYPPPRFESFTPWEELVFSKYMEIGNGVVAAGAALRQLARFGLHDMRKSPRQHRFFFINCNHVLQYYSVEEQRTIVQSMLSSLEPSGFVYLHAVFEKAISGLNLSLQDGHRWLFRYAG